MDILYQHFYPPALTAIPRSDGGIAKPIHLFAGSAHETDHYQLCRHRFLSDPEHNPSLPVTPAEIAEDCIGAAREGAAICHIHVRDPETGEPSMDVAHYREVVRLIRASDTDLLINLTTGPGGRFLPSDHEPARAAPGTKLTTAEIRTEHVVRAEAPTSAALI